MEKSVERNASRWLSKRLARRHVAALFAAGLVVLLATAVAFAATGDITQPAGTAGCVSQGGVESCANGRALRNANGVAVSPDGESVYVASQVGAVARLDRDTTTGAVTQPTGTSGCVREGSALCFKGHALSGASSVAVSPDGKNVYVASYFSDAVVRLNRNPTTGALTEPAGAAGCISEDGSGPCADGHGLNGAWSVALTDGKNVYVASFLAYAVVRLDRDTTTGAITEPAGTAGCVSEDGSGPCADGHGLSSPAGVALSADGKNIYVAAFGAGVARLSRNPTTGAITQSAGTAGCISETGAGACADGHGLDGPSGVAVSGDGKSVYVAATSSPTNSAVARLNRNLTTGALTQPAGTPGCVSETGAGPCAHGHALKGASGVAVSPDGKSVYVASFNSNAAARFNRAP